MLTEEATPANPKNGAYGGQTDMVKRTEGVEVLCYEECSTVNRAADCRVIVERAGRSLNCLDRPL